LANSKDVESLKRSQLDTEVKQVPWLIVQDIRGTVLRSIPFPASVNALITEINNASQAKR
jgi:hypothetical protein